MAAPAFGSPAVKNYSSGSPFSSKFVLLHSNCHWKPELSTCFFGKESLRTFYVGLKTSNFCGSRYLRLSPTASLGGLLGGIFKGTDTGEATRQQYAGTVNTINGLEAEMSGLSDSELRDRTSVLKERTRLGESLDSILRFQPVVVKNNQQRQQNEKSSKLVMDGKAKRQPRSCRGR